jgi:hypothetical protein
MPIVSVVAFKGRELSNSAVSKVQWLDNLQWKWRASKKNCEGFPLFYDLPRKNGAMMQEANVGHGEKLMDKMVRRGGLPCVRR